MVPRKKHSCKFPECGNFYNANVDKGINKHFFKFPKNHDLCVKWKLICGIDINVNSENMRICKDHFRTVDFVNFTKHLLNPNVIPKRSEKSDNLIPVQILPPTTDENLNSCRPLRDANVSAVNTNSFNSDVNSDTVCEETPVHPSCSYDTNTFNNVALSDLVINNSKDANSIKDLNGEEECEEETMCICDQES